MQLLDFSMLGSTLRRLRPPSAPFDRRRPHLGGNLQSSVRVRVTFTTALCPWGRSFISMKSPVWYFLHSCGFGVQASPYHGRQMRIAHATTFCQTIRSFRNHTESGGTANTFFPPHMDGQCQASLTELFQSLSQNLNDDEVWSEESCLRIADAAACLIAQDKEGQLGSANLSAHTKPPNVMLVEPLSFRGKELKAFLDDVNKHCPSREDVERCMSEMMKHIKPKDKVVDGSSTAACDSNPASTTAPPLITSPITVMVTSDTSASLALLSCVLALHRSGELHRMLPVPLPSAALSSNPTLAGVPMSMDGCPQDQSQIEVTTPFTVALCVLSFSVGCGDLEDVVCSVIGVDSSIEGRRLRVLQENVPILSLDRSMCNTLIVCHSELLSHRALRTLRLRFELNEMVSASSQSSTGLLQPWRPFNGGIRTMCIGCHQKPDTLPRDTVRHNASTSMSTSSPDLFWTLEVHPVATRSYPSRLRAYQLQWNHHAQHAYHAVLAAICEATTSSRSVTALDASGELTIRESMVQSFLRSSRPISLQASTALVQSNTRSVAQWLLPSDANAATGGVHVHMANLSEVVQELNYVKVLASQKETTTSAIQRLESLVERTPALRYIGVTHDNLVQCIDLRSLECLHVMTASPATHETLSAARFVNQRVAEMQTNTEAQSLGMVGPTQLVFSRAAERQGFEDAISSARDCGLSTRRFSVMILPPQLIQGGVTTIFCAHSNTPMSLIESTVLHHLEEQLPPGIDLAALGVQRCVAFPLDYVSFFRDGIRQCVAVRLVLAPPSIEGCEGATDPGHETGVDEDTLKEARLMLATALEAIRVAGKPFAMESTPEAVFKPVVHQHAALRPQLNQENAVQQQVLLGGNTSFPFVREEEQLIYPNSVEQRLQAMAATAFPDCTCVDGLAVSILLSMPVLVVGCVHSGMVEQSLSLDSLFMASLVAGTIGRVGGYRSSHDILSALKQLSSSHDGTGTDAKETAANAAAILTKYVEHQGYDGHATLPVVYVDAASCVHTGQGSSSSTTSSVKQYLVVLLPVFALVGGTKSLYEYQLPLVGIPLRPATHCAVNTRYDALYANSSHGLLRELCKKEPFVDCLSARVSFPVFREPPSTTADDAENIRFVVAKASNLIRDLQRAPSSATLASGEELIKEVDSLLCNSPSFTQSVFF